jgi:hypothetical protein
MHWSSGGSPCTGTAEAHPALEQWRLTLHWSSVGWNLYRAAKAHPALEQWRLTLQRNSGGSSCTGEVEAHPTYTGAVEAHPAEEQWRLTLQRNNGGSPYTGAVEALAIGRRNCFFSSFCFLCSKEHFFYFPCTVTGCDGGNRIRNIVVYTWRFSPLSYGRYCITNTDRSSSINTKN